MSNGEPNGEPAVDPVAVHPEPFEAELVRIDAPMEVKRRALSPTVGVPVRRPGEAETVRPLPPNLAPRAAVHGQHNWVPIGPRNVGGRVRALAIQPGSPQIMYAAPASGGIFKTLDGGDSWFPLWHDEPSLSMAAIAICPGTPAVVWAATGEAASPGSDFIAAAGVLRSANSGAEWTQTNVGEAILSTRIHALAAHPTNVNVCWAAAEDGLYRTTDHGQTWHQFGAGRAFTDIAFLTVGANLRLFVVPRGPVTIGPPAANRALVVRIDNPDDPDATLDAAIPAFAGPFAPGADPLLAIGSATPALPGAAPADARDGKLAIFPGGQPGFADPRVFVTFANVNRGLYGIFRSDNAHAGAANTRAFVHMPNHTVMNGERQGEYNLAVAVSPLNPNHLAFGMVELYLNRTAAAAPAAAHWLRAQMGDLYHVERAHHLDHHALVFAPVPAAPFANGAAAGTLALWDANDGGISWCPNWEAGATFPIGTGTTHANATLPLPDNALAWRKRSHGISGAQMYDLTQHPRLPAVMGCGFQDNGVFVGYGGPSWQLVLTADGGFVAFDPDDPYRLLSTFQEGVTECRFPGRLREALPLLRDVIQTGLWPRALNDGFHDGDAALFTAETVLHPTQPGRTLSARRNRLYGMRRTTGDRWVPEPLGTSFEILHRPVSNRPDRSTLEVHDTAGARAIGLLPQLSTVRRTEEGQFESRVRSLAAEPFAIAAGLNVRLTFSNNAVPAVAPVVITVPLTVGAGLPASASAVQVATYLTGAIRTALAATPAATRPRVEVLPAVASATREIVIVSAGSGAARQVVLSGPTATSLSFARAFHGADAGAGPGAASAALPAIAPLMIFRGVNGVDLSGETLRVTREGGANQVDFNWDVDLANSAEATIAEILSVLRGRLPAAQYTVWNGASYRGIRLSSTAATNITITGNLAADLTNEPVTAAGVVAPARSRRVTAPNTVSTWRDTFDLSQTGTPLADRTLRVSEGGNNTATQALNAAFLAVADVTRVTAVELCHAIRRMLAAVPAVRVRCDLDIFADDNSSAGEITELAFGPAGSRVVWAGDSASRLYRSTDDGESWRHVPSPLDDHRGEVDAIAVRPDRSRTVLVGLYSEGAHAAPAQFLFRTDDDAQTWPALAGPPVDDAGDRVGVRGVVFDPASPDHAYAATDYGVFRSIDGGANWAPFNEGLPRAPIMDVTFEPTTRMLRAAAWGRGVYERHVGDRAAKDVLLHIRSTVLDDGTSQPAPGPDPQATRPTPLRFDTSPDIKVLRREPRTGVLLDGVEFDDELRTTDVREGPAFIGVQVHNRGAFPTTGAKVVLLWAPADAGPPPVPPELWPALANPVAAGTAFGAWKVIDDEAITGVAGLGHDVVAPGYPRVNVFGAVLPFSWSAADLAGVRRAGLLAVVRSPDDALGPARTAPIDVIELVRAEPKAGYRECDVIPVAVDESVVLRTTGPTGFTIAAVAPAAQNGANGAAPFGLAAVGAATTAVRFGTNGPYDLSAGPRRFRLRSQATITATLSADEPAIANINRVFGDEVAAILNRHFVEAGLPVSASEASFPGNRNDALVISAIVAARFTVGGTAAGLLGVTAGALTANSTTGFAQRGPWNLSAPGRTLVVNVTTDVEVRLGAGVPEIPTPAVATGADVRAAINRQLVQNGLRSVVAEPIRRSLSVRRSATEATGGRDTVGGLGLADLVATPVAVAGDAGQRALFDVVGTHGADTIAGGVENRMYLRSANTGNVAEAAVRHRLFLLDASVSPVSSAALGAPIIQPIAAGASIIVEFAVPVPAAAAGDRRFVLAIADVDAAGFRLDPAAADLVSIDTMHAFCVQNPNAVIREFVAR